MVQGLDYYVQKNMGISYMGSWELLRWGEVRREGLGRRRLERDVGRRDWKGEAGWMRLEGEVGRVW